MKRQEDPWRVLAGLSQTQVCTNYVAAISHLVKFAPPRMTDQAGKANKGHRLQRGWVGSGAGWITMGPEALSSTVKPQTQSFKLAKTAGMGWVGDD